MSDFDKEAEREKLRKKYARDAEKRANTQRMSDLLLKGATMTNKHCDQCGDPLFRHNGQTFCARCQAEHDGRQDVPADSTGDAEAADGTDSASAAASGTTADPSTESSSVNPTAPSQSATSDSPAETSDSAAHSPASSLASGEKHKTAIGSGTESAADSEELTDARRSLVRTLTRFAQAAETADDPRRARELLSAAREAAETLNALR